MMMVSEHREYRAWCDGEGHGGLTKTGLRRSRAEGRKEPDPTVGQKSLAFQKQQQ